MTERRLWNQSNVVAVAGVAFAAALVCFVGLASSRPLTHHEVLVAQTAREMLQNGDWLLPRYFGEPRLQKPPLAYWTAMLGYRLAGDSSEWAARAPSAFVGVVLAVGVTVAAIHRHGRRVGGLAGLLQASMVYFVTQARLAEADMMLALTVAAALGCYSCLLPRSLRTATPAIRSQRWPCWGFWLFSGLAVLAKGPVGLLFTTSIVVVHTVVDRQPQPLWILLRSWGAIFTFVLLVAAWPIAVMIEFPNAALLWLEESWGRFLRDPNNVVRIPFYYPLALLWLTLPWTPLWLGWLGLELRRFVEGRKWSSQECLLLCWLVVPIAFLSLSSGKQEHYLVPALPPCSLWAARGLRLIVRRLRSVRFGSETAAGMGFSTLRRWSGAGLASSPFVVIGAILLVQTLALPAIDNRRDAVVWWQRNQPDDRTIPVVALGHSVQWLGFYGAGPMERVDSLEEFFDRFRDGEAWVLTTQAVGVDVARYRPVLARRESASRLRAKDPVLLRVGAQGASPAVAPPVLSRGRTIARR